MIKSPIHIIGGGTAALFLAAALDTTKYQVTIYERNKAPGRKFLVAGDGGLNLSYNETPEKMLGRYMPTNLFHSLSPYLNVETIRSWFRGIGIETYVGSSNRVFPIEGIKPITVLNALLETLTQKGVIIETEHEWIGFSESNHVLIHNPNGTFELDEGKVVFALGGASWKKTGSTGEWLHHFAEKGIRTMPFQPSNCAFEIKWPVDVLEKLAGQPLKNVSITCGTKTVNGEVVLTKFGIEGSGIYPLSGKIREVLNENNEACIFIDFKPVWTEARMHEALINTKGSTSDRLRQGLKLAPTVMLLLKQFLPKETFTNTELLCKALKAFPLRITATAPLDDAISTVGGIDCDEVDQKFEFKKLKNYFAIGEQLDWDAPTGGYLITGCFAQAMHLAATLNHRID